MSRPMLFAEAQKTAPAEVEPKTVLFVCTGNTCRSPMAAALFNALCGRAARRADSAGLYADGSPISKNAVAALIRRGIPAEGNNDYIAHVSKPVTEVLVSRAAMVVGMTGRHAMELTLRFPQYASKIYAMPKDISDPFGGELAVYEACLGEIEEAIRLLGEEDANG